MPYESRLFVTGKTGSGKSRFVRALFEQAPPPKLAIDPQDSALTHLPGCFTFRTPDEWDPAAPVARFVPVDPFDLDAYDAVYRHVNAGGPRMVWLDEAGIAAPASRTPAGIGLVLVQGRKRRIGHIACHTRPVEVSRAIVSQASHLVCFFLGDPRDRKVMAEAMGLDPAEFGRLLDGLDPYGFLVYDVHAGVVHRCSPLPAPRS